MTDFFSALRSIPRLFRRARRAPNHNRAMIVESLEGRQLLSQAQAIQSFVTLPVSLSNIIAGPGGALWVGVRTTDTTTAIDRIALNGKITSFPVPGKASAGYAVESLTTGPDGNVWFLAGYNPSIDDNEVIIGKVTPYGKVTTFPPLTVPPGQGAGGLSIVDGPGRSLWFGYENVHFSGGSQNFIGRITTAGAVKLFPVSPLSSGSGVLGSVAAGADGNLWFTDILGDQPFVGRMSPRGVVHRLSIDPLRPKDVANGPNGSLIVTASDAKWQNQVVRIAESGAVTRYPIPVAMSDAFFAYLGYARGSLWFTEEYPNLKIGRITPKGVAESYDLSYLAPGRQYDVESMAVGRDGNLYVLDNALGLSDARIYRISQSKLRTTEHGSSGRGL